MKKDNLIEMIFENIISGKIEKEIGAKILTELRFSPNTEDIAIIGIGINLPMAGDTDEFWDNLRNETDSVIDFPENRKRDVDRYLDYMGHYSDKRDYSVGAYLAEIDKFDYDFFRLSPREASLMSPNQKLFLQTAWHTIEDAGYSKAKIAGTKTGVYIGFSGDELFDYKRLILDVSPEDISAALPGNLSSVIAGRIAYLLDLKGPSMLIDTACSSSLVAVHLACQSLRANECEMALAGGVRTHLFRMNGDLDIGIQSGDGRTKSFDDASEGTGCGEGVAAILLKPLNKAIADKDNIYAVIKGSSVNQDGSSIGLTAPNVIAQENVIAAAWESAGIDPATISYIEAHGTGTNIGDPIEIEGISRAFLRYTDKKQFCALGSVKTNIGHLDQAAGIVGLIKAVISVKNKQLAPMLHLNKPNRKIDFMKSPLYLCNELSDWQPESGIRRCGVSSFGMSGTNCHIVLEELPHQDEEKTNRSDSLNILTLSAKNKDVLKLLVKKYQEFLEKNTQFDLDDLCYTANAGRDKFRFRLAMIISSRDDLINKIKSLSELEVDRCFNNEIFYGEFKVTDADKAVREAFEISISEQKMWTVQINEILDQLPETSTAEFAPLAEIGRLFVKGGEIPWERLYAGEQRKRISLPGYPFASKRSWINIPQYQNHSAEGNLSIRTWINKEIDRQENFSDRGPVLIFNDLAGLGDQVEARMKRKNIEVYQINIADKFEKVNDYHYTVTNNLTDYVQLFECFKDKKISRILHLSSYGRNDRIKNLDQLEAYLALGFYSLLYITKALNDVGFDDPIDVLLVSQDVDMVTKKETNISPQNGALFGLGKVIRWEHPNLNIRTIDFDDNGKVELIISEMCNQGKFHYRVAYRNGQRYVEVLERLNLTRQKSEHPFFSNKGVYIITGGTGAIGLKMAKYLADNGALKIALIGRSQLPLRADQLTKIKEIEESGTEVRILRADVAEFDSMRVVIESVRNQFGPIIGVIHAAGTGDGTLVSIDQEANIKSTLAPKIQGTWIIDELTKDDQLELFIMCSSAITLMGGLGGGSYTAANTYLNSFAAKRTVNGAHALTVNWPVWYETGLSEGVDSHEEKQLFKIIHPLDAMETFDQVIRSQITNEIIIGEMNYESSLFDSQYELPFTLSKEIESKIVKKAGTEKRKPVNARVKTTETKLLGKEDFTECEKGLADIWGEVLGLSEINSYDNFYELGGDSLIATRIINLINRRLDISLEIQDFFKHLTINDLAKCMEDKYLNGQEVVSLYAKIHRSDERDYYPLSSAQKRIFILSQFDKGSCHYNEPAVMRIKGGLDILKFEQAIKKLIKRHDALRTSFQLIGDEPFQLIQSDLEIQIEYLDRIGPDFTICMEDFITPFDLSEAPLMRVTLVTCSTEDYYLIFDMHHIICDGTSMHILLQDFISFYEGRELSSLAIQYKDFSIWQEDIFNRDIIKTQQEYWLDIFQGEVPHLNLTTDFKRPAEQSFEGKTVKAVIDHSLSKEITSLASLNGATLYMTLLAAFNVLLTKYTNDEDIVVGSPIEGRHNADLNNVMGIFINTLAMRNKPQHSKAFNVFLQEVKENALNAYENQDFQFEKLIEKLAVDRDLSRNPLFDVMFALHYYTKDQIIQVGQLTFQPVEFENNVTKFDLSLIAVETNGQIILEFQYASKLFNRQTIERMAAHYITLLRSIVEGPTQKISALEMLTEGERDRILNHFSEPVNEHLYDKTICQLFAEQAAKTPQNIALMFKEHSCTYHELNIRSNQIANMLQDKGIGSGSIVGIMAERSIEMMTGIFGIIKSGAAYLPIDPYYPGKRIDYIIENSGLSLLFTQKKFIGARSYNVELFNLEDSDGYDGLSDTFETTVSLEDAAYVIYTSGSTGEPKGVVIEHKALSNRLNWMQQEYSLTQNDVLIQKTPITFDVSVWELFWWAVHGAALAVPEPGVHKEPQQIIDFIKKNRVTMIHFVPSMLGVFLDYVEMFEEMDKLKSLTVIFSSGEELKRKHLDTFNRVFSGRHDIKLINLYGPTEATVDVSYFNCPQEYDADMIPIGKPIDNIKFYILDPNNALTAIGVPGELCIAGVGLARGYLNNTALTKEKFIESPFVEGERLYRTGDLAKWGSDGNVFFLGRLDHQVKIRGNRIEIGEIESRLVKFKDVSEAVVVVLKEDENEYLCAYYVSSMAVKIEELHQYLAENLPDYMLPSAYVQLPGIPLTANGKVNRKELPLPLKNQGDLDAFTAPQNQMEELLVEIWAKVLGYDQISTTANYFLLGGDSIKAIQIIAKLKQHGFRLEIKDLFKYPAIAVLAGHIYVDTHEISQEPVQGEVQLTPIQKWFFEQDLAEAHYWNQAVHLYREAGFEEAVIKTVFEKLAVHHDALRMTYPLEREGRRQQNQNLSHPLFELQVYEVDEFAAVDDFMKQAVEKGQGRVDLTSGPLMNLYLFKTAVGDYLSIVIHHLIVDGVSWRILLEDFSTIYRQVSTKQEMLLPDKTDSYLAWARSLIKHSLSKSTLNELIYWNGFSKAEAYTLNKDYSVPGSERTLKDKEYQSVELSAENTERLLNKINITYNTETLDLLLTALGLAFKTLTKRNEILIYLEGHGREPISEMIDVSRTVGWFTSLFPAFIDLTDSQDLSYIIKTVKEGLRRIPNKGFNYGVLKYLTPENNDNHLNFSAVPEICFNYWGQIENDENDVFEILDIQSINTVSSNNKMLYAVEINSMVKNDRLITTFVYHKKEFKYETIEKLASSYLNLLNDIIMHCYEKESVESTPADFGDDDLTLEDLQQIMDVFEEA